MSFSFRTTIPTLFITGRSFNHENRKTYKLREINNILRAKITLTIFTFLKVMVVLRFLKISGFFQDCSQLNYWNSGLIMAFVLGTCIYFLISPTLKFYVRELNFIIIIHVWAQSDHAKYNLLYNCLDRVSFLRAVTGFILSEWALVLSSGQTEFFLPVYFWPAFQ